MTLASVVPMQGASVEFPVRRVLAFLKESGLEGADVVLKSDQENAILNVLNTIASRRAASSKVEPVSDEERKDRRDLGGPLHRGGGGDQESSPVGSSGSNGFISENA